MRGRPAYDEGVEDAPESGGEARVGGDHDVLAGGSAPRHDARRLHRLKPSSTGAVLGAALLLSVGVGCGQNDDEDGVAESTFAGRIDIDGSSTVEPFTAAAADRFQDENPGVAVVSSISPSGTGGGFQRFCAGEIDLANASRPIENDEQRACRAGGIEYLVLQVANDAVTVVVNSENDWADCLETGELEKIWEPGSNVNSWSEVRPEFPDVDLELFGPGSDSGTLDYFTGEIVGKEGAIRSDYSASEDDYVTVQGVAEAEGGLGYFGLSYFSGNKDRLKALEVDGGTGCVAPSVETAQSGDYALSRPLFIYVKYDALREPPVRAFVEYLLDNAVSLAEEALLVPVTDTQLERERAEFDEASGAGGDAAPAPARQAASR
jgi:phosphate transport system substrate-binding protein